MEQWFFLVVGLLVGGMAGHRIGRETERDEPSATDEQLLRWIVQRRMRANLTEKLEMAYRQEVERELSRTTVRDKPYVKDSGGEWGS